MSDVLPFSIEAEVSVIGGMWLEPENIPVITSKVSAEDFYTDSYRRVYRALSDLYEARSAVDTVTLIERLKANGDYDAIGGAVGLAFIGEVPTAANIEYHCGIVAKYAARRRLVSAARSIIDLASDPSQDDPDALVAEAERLIAGSVSVTGDDEGFESAASLLNGEMLRLEAIDKPDAEVGVRTGLATVDDMLGGMENGDLVIVAGRPSMGKSAFGVCNIAADAAVRQGLNVAIFSLETKKDRVLTRILGSEAHVNMAAAKKRRRLLDEDYPRIAQGTGLLRTSSLHIDYTPGLTLAQMRVKLRKLVRKVGKIGLVVVDYLQLMTHPKSKHRLDEVNAIASGLKRIAQEFDCPMVALSQLSRRCEERPDKRPMMSDLRESGNLEQDADIIMLLYRAEYYFGPQITVKEGKENQKVTVEGKGEIILAKVRDGQTGTAVVGWEKEHTHFRDINR